jgi:Membrane-bound lysozyme-inhibitor of c-type lysozyme.
MKMKEKSFYLMPFMALALFVGCKQNKTSDTAAEVGPDVVVFAATDAQNRISEVRVDFSNADTAVVFMNDLSYRLPVCLTASGFGYKDSRMEFMGKGRMATLTDADGSSFTLIERMEKNGVGFDLSVDRDGRVLTIVPLWVFREE